jgi:hypothetical protein
VQVLSDLHNTFFNRLEVGATRGAVESVADLQLSAVGAVEGPSEATPAGPAGSRHSHLDLADNLRHGRLEFSWIVSGALRVVEQFHVT